MFPRFFSAAAAAFLLAETTYAQARATAVRVDPAVLLKELQAIQQKQQLVRSAQLGQLASQVMDASRTQSSAQHFYMDAVRKVQFGSNTGGGFQDWKKGHKDLLENKVFLTALMFHLRYLAISLEAASGAKPGALPPLADLSAYVKDVARAGGMLSQSGLRDDNDRTFKGLLFEENALSDNVFALALAIKPDLEKFIADSGYGGKWGARPGVWQEILNFDVRVPLRMLKDPRLLESWQLEIDAQGATASGGRPGADGSDFWQVELPKLLWGRAQDLIVLGHTDDAIVEMTRLVKTYPTHPDLQSWMDVLLPLVKAKMSPAAEAPGDPGPAASSAGS